MDELLRVRFDNWDNPYSDLAIRELDRITRVHPRSFKEVKNIILEYDWDFFRASEIHQFMNQNKDVELTEEQLDILKKWCQDNLDTVDFRNALQKSENGGVRVNNKTTMLWYFIRKLDLECPKNILLDLLSFDWIEGHGMAGIIYLEDRLEKHEISKRILKNLSEGITFHAVLKNHLDYCRQHGISEVIPFAVDTVKDSDQENDVREIAVETLSVLDEGKEHLKSLSEEVKDEFRWSIINKMKEIDSVFTIEVLKDILDSGQDQEKYKAAKLLIEMKDLDGLQYLATIIKEKKINPFNYHEESIFKKLTTTEAIPLLMELLEVTYDPDFVDKQLPSIQDIVLETLRTITIANHCFEEIQGGIIDFIERKEHENDDVRHLHSYLIRLERNIYINKSLNITLTDAISMVDRVL